jgi:hypothetical protein
MFMAIKYDKKLAMLHFRAASSEILPNLSFWRFNFEEKYVNAITA